MPDLIQSGVITDPGMIYFDTRPSAHLPTPELRICDACPRLADVVLLAGLFRALVIRETSAVLAGRAPMPVRPQLLEAATWRAARSGLEGQLVDPATALPVPARQLVGQLLTSLRPALEATGDWELVAALTRSALARGSSAARQRAAYARGGLQHVVDTLIEETRASTGLDPKGRRQGQAAGEADAMSRVVSRLRQQFPDLEAQQIETAVQSHYVEFDGRPVRDFVPILVERSAYQDLNAARPARGSR